VDTIALRGRIRDRDSWTATNCSVRRALDVVGTRSAMLIMREAFYGARRFDEFTRRVQITEAVAAARLRELTDAGLLARTPYQEPGQRTRYEYELTEMGRDLAPALLALMQWGDRYLADQPGGPMKITHEQCGEPVHVEVRCAAGHEVGLGDLEMRASRRTR
jgi:DNA-binding HxlR family transcriptional regulator